MHILKKATDDSTMQIKDRSNIRTLVEVNQVIKFMFGILKLKIARGKLTKVSKLYRIYALILGIFIFSIGIWETIKAFVNGSKPYKIELVTHVLTFFIIELSYFSLIFQVVKNPEISMKLYKNISYIDGKLGVKIYDKKFTIILILVHFMYIVIRIYSEFNDIYIWGYMYKYIVLIFGFSTHCIDIEIINCVIEANEVARRFEILNDRLKMYIESNFEQSCIDLRLNEGLLMFIWKNSKNKTNKKISDIGLKIYLNIFHTLSDTIEQINSVLSFVVFFKNLFSEIIIYSLCFVNLIS